MGSVYDRSAPKKPTNLSLNGDLLKKARDLGVNLSSELEGALEDIVRRRLCERWREQNHDAIVAYNERVESSGVFSDGVRSF